jgi:hypothetical protein
MEGSHYHHEGSAFSPGYLALIAHFVIHVYPDRWGYGTGNVV